MTWRLIGSSGLFAGSRLKKCGVTASASLSPDSKTPLRSSSLNFRCFSSCARVVTLFLSCHFQSFQSSGVVSDQYPGACETKSFPSPFSEAKVFIFVLVDEKVKTLKYRVNAGTWPCATHVNETVRAARSDGPSAVVQRRFVRSIVFATCNKNESCPCLASNDNPTGTPSALAIGSDTSGRRPIPATLVSDNVRG